MKINLGESIGATGLGLGKLDSRKGNKGENFEE